MTSLLTYLAVAVLGGTIGAIGMALLAVASRADKEAER